MAEVLYLTLYSTSVTLIFIADVENFVALVFIVKSFGRCMVALFLSSVIISVKGKGKVIPLQARCDPKGG